MDKSKQQLNNLQSFEFAKTPVLAGINTIGEVVALKPIVENLGLNWPAQQRVIKNDPKLNQLLLSHPCIGADGRSREMLCMTHNSFNDWLWNLSPKSENFKVELWESYKKGLVIFLLGMLKVSLDELQKGSFSNTAFHQLRELNAEKKQVDKELLIIKEKEKQARSRIADLQKQIDEILESNPNQLKLMI